MRKGLDWPTTAGFIAILLWSGSVAFTRSLTEKLGSLGAGALIFTLSGALLLIVDLVRSPAETRGWFRVLTPRYALGCGGIFILYTFSYNLAIGLAHDRHQAMELALLNYLWPALTILFSLILLPMRATWAVYPGVGGSLFGVFLVMTAGGGITWRSFSANVADNPVAYAAGLSAGITWALYSVLIRRWAPSGRGSVSLFLIASGLSLSLASAAFPARTVLVSFRLVAEAVAMVMATALAYGFWDLAMRRGKVVRVAAASYFMPVLATLFSCVYLHVSPDPRLWVGSAIIAAGSLMCWRAVRETKGPPARA